MSRIFVSYRRTDSGMAAGRIYDHLVDHFGAGHIFMDIDSIQPGVDFVGVIEEAVGECDALVVVIGKQWLTATDAKGARRLDDPGDFVRLEIATALDRDIRVIPVLVDGAIMPRAEQLPDALAKLARRNALEITNERFHFDIGRLIKTLEEVLKSRPQTPEEVLPPAVELLPKVRDPNPYMTLEPFYHLKMLSEPEEGKVYPLTVSRILVGRNSSADINIEHRTVSRSHFALNWDANSNTFVLIDFHARSPILVNGEFVEGGQRKLVHGDVITVGGVKLAFLRRD